MQCALKIVILLYELLQSHLHIQITDIAPLKLRAFIGVAPLCVSWKEQIHPS